MRSYFLSSRKLVSLISVAVLIGLAAPPAQSQPVPAPPVDAELSAEPDAAAATSEATTSQSPLQATSVTPGSSGRWMTATPDPEGFEVVVGGDGSGPRTVARLSIPGMDSRLWIGYACLTGSGRYVAAAFAPTEFLDDPGLRDAGFLAVIDIDRGEASLVDGLVTMAYHNPGCGPSDEIAAVRRQIVPEVGPSTEVLAVDASRGTIAWRRSEPGSLTSPAPTQDQVFLSGGFDLVSVRQHGLDRISSFSGEVVDLVASEGTVDLSIVEGDTIRAYRDAAGDPSLVVVARVGQVRWSALPSGNKVTVVGQAAIHQPDRAITASEHPDAVSPDGSMVLIPEEPGATYQVTGPGEVATTEQLTFSGPVATLDGDASFEPLADPACAIPRNDPSIQILQPSTEQIEWAAHRAVRGELTFTRPQNWQNNGLPAYTPQGVFPLVPLEGGGRIPAQVLMGVLAQESNFWQAAPGAVPGVAGNPLIGNYYGVVYDGNGRIIDFDFADSDCGYGVGQITDGMTVADTGSARRSAAQQKMIATDYAANIAEAAYILATKWNLLYGEMIPPGTDPAKVENWYLPLWAYNCCFYDSSNLPWGVGWANNPANSDYRFDRRYFLREGLDDAKTPGDWTYPERVFGFVEHGLWLRGEQAFTPIEGVLRGLPVVDIGLGVDPYFWPVDRFTFCTTSNQCSPTHYDPGDQPERGDRSFCTRPDRRCWWNDPPPIGATEIYENPATHVPGAPEPSLALTYPSACDENDAAMPDHGALGSIPASARIVDDVPAGTPNLGGCANVETSGSFAFRPGPTLADIDKHQIGSGYGGHFWYGHTNWEARSSHTLTGVWTPPSGTTGWQRILVHIPPVGADTYQADYRIFDGTEQAGQPSTYHRVVNQRWNENRWVDLGSFLLSPGARVELSNVTYSDHGEPVPERRVRYGDDRGVDDDYRDRRDVSIAWDAVAFVPSSAPDVSMVAFGDSYSAGEGAWYTNFSHPSDRPPNSSNATNACHRAYTAYGPRAFGQLADAATGPASFAFIACSGAKLRDDLLGPETMWGEVPQVDQGWVDDTTTHITLGIGGNDLRFAPILEHCLISITERCFDGDAFDDEPGTIAEQFDRSIIDVETDYRNFVATLRDLADPSTRIVLVGYPYVIEQGSFFGPNPLCTGFSELELLWLRSSTDRANDMLARIADDFAEVEFAPIMNAYFGHGACAEDPYINAIDLQPCGACLADLWPDLVAKNGSFHPTEDGHQAATPFVVDALTRPAGSADGTGRIEGRITANFQATFDIVDVDLYQRSANGNRGPGVDRVSTTSEGRYAFPAVQPGCYIVALTAPPGGVFEIGRQPTLDIPVCVQSGETRVADAAIYEDNVASIFGHVERQGDWVSGIAIDLFESNIDAERLGWIESTTTNANTDRASFEFKVRTLLPGCWVLTFVAPLGESFLNGTRWHNEHVCLLIGETEAPEIVVTMVGDGSGGVGGTVTREGQGVDGLTANLYQAGGDGSRSTWLGSTTTDASGTYSFSAGTGCYVITLGPAPPGTAFAGGSEWLNLSTCVPEGGQSTDNDAVLTGVGDLSVSGTASNSGQPVVALGADLFLQAADGSRGQWLASTTTDTDGTYRFVVQPGCYVLTFGPAPDGSSFTSGSVWENRSFCLETSSVVVPVVLVGNSDASISGEVTRSGSGQSGVNVDLFQVNGDGTRGAYLRSAATDGAGSYTFAVNAGCYILTFVAPSGQTFTNGSQWLETALCVSPGQASTGNDAELQ